MPKIFISYRRVDSRSSAERIHDRLVHEYGFDNVFLDVDRNIPPGSDFETVLQRRLEETDVLIVVMGSKYLDELNRRLRTDSTDYVRMEVSYGLSDIKLVIPVQVEGASFPSPLGLPEDMSGLLRLNGIEVRSNPDFHGDMSNIVKEINNIFPDLTFVEESVPTIESINRSLRTRRLTRIGIPVATVVLIMMVLAIIAADMFSPASLSDIVTDVPDAEAVAALLLTRTVEPPAMYSPDATQIIETAIVNLLVTETQKAQLLINSYTNTPSPTTAPSLTSTSTASNTPSNTPTANTPTVRPNLTETAFTIATSNQIATEEAIAQTNEINLQIAQLTANAPTNTLIPFDTLINTLTYTPFPTETIAPTNTLTSTLTPTVSATSTPNGSKTAQAQMNSSATQEAVQTQVFEHAVATENAKRTLQVQTELDATATQEAIWTQEFIEEGFASDVTMNITATISAIVENDEALEGLELVLRDKTNVRSGPGLQYEIKGYISEGNTIEVFGRNREGDWVFYSGGIWLTGASEDIELSEWFGWIYSPNLLNATLDQLPIIGLIDIEVTSPDAANSESLTSQQSQIRGESKNSYATINTDNANFRSGPGVEYDIVQGASVDEVVRVLARTNTIDVWFLVQASNENILWAWEGIIDFGFDFDSVEVVGTIPPLPSQIEPTWTPIRLNSPIPLGNRVKLAADSASLEGGFRPHLDRCGNLSTTSMIYYDRNTLIYGTILDFSVCSNDSFFFVQLDRGDKYWIRSEYVHLP